MPSDSPSHGGRRHFHRGRRGHDRRGGERRTPSSQSQPQEQSSRGDHVDVEQIMREIRSTIAQRQGVDLTDQQVQELAARRLESILDPRTMKPSLLDQLRKNAGSRPDTVAAADRASIPYEFEDTTLYESPNAFIRFIRRLLNPVLKLFFNPNPLIRALHIQARLNAEATRREAERDQRQAEWNALHYEILQRVVSETAKVSLEVQNLSLKVESLSTKVDFNERRVRGIEGAVQPRPAGGRERERDRDRESLPAPVAASVAAPEPVSTTPPTGGPEGVASEAPRRKRRRRRGRRGGGMGEMAPAVPAAAAAIETFDTDEGDEGEELADAPDVVTTGTDAIQQTDEEAPIAVNAEVAAPERVTPQLKVSDPAAREEAAPELPGKVEDGEVESGK